MAESRDIAQPAHEPQLNPTIESNLIAEKIRNECNYPISYTEFLNN